MVEWLIKTVIVGKVNALLDERKRNVAQIRETLGVWLARIKGVVSCLESLSAKLADNAITADELREASEEIAATVKAW